MSSKVPLEIDQQKLQHQSLLSWRKLTGPLEKLFPMSSLSELCSYFANKVQYEYGFGIFWLCFFLWCW